MGPLAWCLGIESILLESRDENLQLLLCLSTHIMEGRLKISETYQTSEEIISFYRQFLQTLYSTSNYIEENCHVLVTSLYNLNLACQHIKWKTSNIGNKSEI